MSFKNSQDRVKRVLEDGGKMVKTIAKTTMPVSAAVVETGVQLGGMLFKAAKGNGITGTANDFVGQVKQQNRDNFVNYANNAGMAR